MEGYLSSPVRVLGVPARGYIAIAREFEREHGRIPMTKLHALCRELRNGSTFEERTLAVVLLGRRRREMNHATWRLANSWIDSSTGWGLCDGLASGVIADMVLADLSHLSELREWTKSKNPWRRRAALYALNRIVRSGDLDHAIPIIKALIRDPEFWVQRAVGTWLRECWKKDSRRVQEFLIGNAKGLPRTVVTVATERAPKSFRERLRAMASSKRW